MNLKRALPPLARLLTVSLLSACASKPQAPRPIPAVAEQRLCPHYPLPPEGLLKPPAKTDFLQATPSRQPSRPSSSMN